MSITYSITIDRNDDGDYTDLNEALETDVIDLRWQLGFAKCYAALSSPAHAEITVRNYGGTYSPELNVLLTGKRVQIQSDDGTTIRTQFTGEIARIEPLAGEYGQQTAVIHVNGREIEVAENRVRLPAMIVVRADEVIDAIFDRLSLRYPVLDGYCILDQSGFNLIDSVSIFGDDAVTRQFDTGKSTFAYVGDNWSSGVRADVALQDVVQSESGRFFFNRAGEAVFHHRHHDMATITTQATFSDDMDELTYIYGADQITQVSVHIRPRSIGAANTLIWSLATPLRLLCGQTYTIVARYEVDNQAVGLVSTLTVDYLARLDETSTSLDVSEQVQVFVMETGFSAATLEIRNKAGRDVYLHEVDLYGTPLIQGNRLTLNAQDALAKTLYGLRVYELDLPALSDIEEAAAVAEYEFQRRSTPRGLITELKTSIRNHPIETLALTLFDRIHISESQTGHAGYYRIIAEKHHVTQGGARHHVSWLLEPDQSAIFFVINTHTIDDEQVLLPR